MILKISNNVTLSNLEIGTLIVCDQNVYEIIALDNYFIYLDNIDTAILEDLNLSKVNECPNCQRFLNNCLKKEIEFNDFGANI